MMMIDKDFALMGSTGISRILRSSVFYHDRTVYRNIEGIKSFEASLGQLETESTYEELMKIAEGNPSRLVCRRSFQVFQELEAYSDGRKSFRNYFNNPCDGQGFLPRSTFAAGFVLTHSRHYIS